MHLQDSFNSVVDIFNWYGDNQNELIPAAGKGRWNDPDMVSEVSVQLMLSCIIYTFYKTGTFLLPEPAIAGSENERESGTAIMHDSI